MRLVDSLKPSTAEAIVACLKDLMEGLWTFPNKVPFERAVVQYVKALSDKSSGAVKTVTENMLAGKYDFCDRGFIPIPAHFARLCDEERQLIASKIAEIRRSDNRRLPIWNTLPDDWNNRQREEEIDRILLARDLGR